MNEGLRLLESELRLIERRLLESPQRFTDDPVATQTQATTREFLRANAALLEEAAAAYAKLSIAEREELCKKHNLTSSIIYMSDAAGFVRDAVKLARNPLWEHPNFLRAYEHAMFEMLPRVVSYAKHVVPAGPQSVRMSPILAHLPRRLERLAVLHQENGQPAIRVEVWGGLAEENQAAFEAVRFPLGSAILKTVAVAIGESGGTVDTPFRTVLHCNSAAAPGVIDALKEGGFTVQEG